VHWSHACALCRRANLARSFKRQQQQQQQQQLDTEAAQTFTAAAGDKAAFGTADSIVAAAAATAAAAAVSEQATADTTALVAMPDSTAMPTSLPIDSAAIEDDAVSAFTVADYGESLFKTSILKLYSPCEINSHWLLFHNAISVRLYRAKGYHAVLCLSSTAVTA
jgi:hypothetical protein